MTFADLFNSGFTTRNQDHFASIVKVAFSDNFISEEEKTFLDRLAQKLDISKESYASILKDYKSHPINPPASLEKRIERLYDLARIVHIDHIRDVHEITMLSKIAIGLGFDTKIVSKVVHKALKLVFEKVDLEVFKKEMKTILS
ncbi:TerB family tellurite resistance protein [Flavobacteriaceae bacterium]|jgi:uncharacterized tellurite resistance protein B-like protein|nr:TerB family tellurite resistance protein [Flavobacteriaceae bacterium]